MRCLAVLVLRSSTRQEPSQLHLAFPDWDAESFAVNGVVDSIVVPAHPSAEWFDHEEPKFKRLWIIVDSYNDSTTEQLLTSFRSFHLKIQRTFPNGLNVLLWHNREP